MVEGPVGLLEGRRAIVAVASGGTRAGSEIDFATALLRHVRGFADMSFVAADGIAPGTGASPARAGRRPPEGGVSRMRQFFLRLRGFCWTLPPPSTL